MKIRPSFRAPWILFWAGWLVRVVYITVAHTYRFRPFEDHFTYAYEMGRIARALVTGFGYSDPFNGHTGPTAWLPPLYPLLIAAAFKLFGVYSLKAAWVLLVMNSAFSAATAMCVYEIAWRCFNPRVANWSGWIWALYPAALQYGVRWIWETTLSVFLLMAILLLAMRMRGIGEHESETQQTTGHWLLFGLLWGMVALSNPALLLFLPVCGLWLLTGHRNFARGLVQATLAGILFIACISPWVIRNWRVFHTFIPMRDNFGAELYAGNGPGSYGFRYGVLIGLPERDPQHQLYTKLGEVAYVHERGLLAKAYIKAHPRHFLVLTLNRIYFFWASVPHPTQKHDFLDIVRQLNFCLPSITGILGLLLALRRRVPAAGLLGWAFVLLPLTYYFVTVEARFRHPLEPLIVIFSVYLFQSATPKKTAALS
ncbi:ArnT family glycosyltransferase [Silvibacterium acidisoli]|uniref:ArnT family glycosyltransferase n=1 Tax=Acidobacteriaceae bacterium ZG23-2 TaxID=2883246 RepID=UPI00406D0919